MGPDQGDFYFFFAEPRALLVSFPSPILIHLTFVVLWGVVWFRSEFL